jgi:hypothetical protein
MDINSWNISEEDPVWAAESVINSLSSLPLLENLELTVLSSPCVSLPWNKLAGLRSITLSGYDSHIPLQSLVQQLGEAIANSPQLSYLGLHCGQSSACHDSPTLHDLLRMVSSSNPLRLKHLRLDGWCTRLDSITLPHLKSITSLDLSNNLWRPVGSATKLGDPEELALRDHRLYRRCAPELP